MERNEVAGWFDAYARKLEQEAVYYAHRPGQTEMTVLEANAKSAHQIAECIRKNINPETVAQPFVVKSLNPNTQKNT